MYKQCFGLRIIDVLVLIPLLFLAYQGGAQVNMAAPLHPVPLTENPHELHVLTYNTYMRAPQFLFLNKQKKRNNLFPEFLEGYDVVVLQEVFINKKRKQLFEKLKHRYPYQTKILAKDKFLRQDGGVIIFSKWPLEKEDEKLFEVCAGADCLAKKGVVYAKVNKGDRVYHIFGTHVQAGSKHRGTREQQYRTIRSFMEEQAIPSSEPVIITGDLNVDLYTDSEDGAYSKMLEILDATHPQARPGPDYAPTIDGTRNSFVKHGDRQHLDYALFSANHLVPKVSFNEVRIFRKDEQDISDHYAVYGFFSFPTSQD